MPEAFFLPDGDSFVATELTRGPWNEHHQHGGPPSALLGRAIERFHPREEMQIVRVTIEILRPVPIAKLDTDVAMSRPGGSVEMLDASLTAAGTEVMRARAWRMRTTGLDLPEGEREPLPSPDRGTHEPFFSAAAHKVGYHTATEWRFLRGGFRHPGPGTAWIRVNVPLVAGEEPSPLVRVLAVADSGNGVSAPLNPARFLFVNTDLTVQLYREAEGEWIALESETIVERSGVGVTDTVLYDREGRIGRGLQTLFVSTR